MPDEPNSKIGEQLKAWARTRRGQEGAPFELHPATRRLLHDEVAKTFPSKKAERAPRASGWLELLWPRFALAGALCVVLLVIVALLAPGLHRLRSRSQQVALVREQDGATPPPVLPRAVENESFTASRDAVEVRRKTADAREPAVESKLIQNRSMVANANSSDVPAAPGLKDERLAPAQVRARTDTTTESDLGKQLAYLDKAKEAAPTAERSTARREGYAENERNEALLRQRYGLVPAQANAASSVGSSVEKPAPATAPISARQLTFARTNAGAAVDRLAGLNLAGGALSNQPESTVALKSAPMGAASGQFARELPGSKAPALAGPSDTDRMSAGRAYAYNPAGEVPGQLSQQFAQAAKYRPNFNSPPAPNVLQSFRVEQTGQQIRLLDADGSIYDGAIEPSQAEEGAKRSVQRISTADLKKTSELAQKADAFGGLATPQNLFFRVAGTNRTLNQLVVFQGNLLAAGNATNAVVNSVQLDERQLPAGTATGATQNQLRLSNALIQGQAIIGGSNRVEINAAPVGP